MTYQIATHDLEAQPVISIRARHAQGEIPAFLGRSFGELFGQLTILGVTPSGPPLVIYHEFGPTEIDAEVCVPIGRDVTATGTVRTRILPAATVVRTLHVGPYEALGAAYEALNAWVAQQDLAVAGPVQERYLNGPGDTGSPAEYRTEIELPVVPKVAPVAV
jgi:effector-binding domain-containing protein